MLVKGLLIADNYTAQYWIVRAIYIIPLFDIIYPIIVICLLYCNPGKGFLHMGWGELVDTGIKRYLNSGGLNDSSLVLK